MATNVEMADGRTVHVYDSYDSDRPGDPPPLTVFWHHGTPQTGRPPEPPPMASAQRVRWIGHDRPGYGTSSPSSGRDVAAVAADVTAIADHLGVARFAVAGYSAGGPHALACAALLADRVHAVVCIASTAPFEAAGLDWYRDMVESNAAELRAATQGRGPLKAHLAGEHELDPDMFAPADLAALGGPYGEWLRSTTTAALDGSEDGYLDDDDALVNPWGFAVADVAQPVLVLHGEHDRLVPTAHARWLADRCPIAELRLYPDEGHISIIDRIDAAMDWLDKVDQPS
ncbi:MAG TPA: alpha/beta hydrolase [Pseudonocardia sp.]